jgi:hypothetical protein
MGLVNALILFVVDPVSLDTPVTESTLVMSDRRRTISCSVFGEVPARIQNPFEELVNGVKVIPKRRWSDLTKVLDENVQKSADESNGI